MVQIVGNRSDFVENGSEKGWTSPKPNSRRRAVRWGWTGNIPGNILLARLGSGIWLGARLGSWLVARLELRRLGFWLGLSGSAWLKYGARGAQSSSSSGRVGYSTKISNGECGPPCAPINLIFAPLSLYGWALHFGMIKMCVWQLWKFGYIPEKLLFSDEQGSDTNCWWEKPLVVALKHSEGIKHTVLFQEQKLTTTLKSLQHNPSLSL